MRTSTLLVATLLVPVAVNAQGTDRYRLTIGVVDSIKSATLNETRRYIVYTPPSYTDTINTPQHYPVLYLLDGDAHFHSVTGLVHILATGINGTRVFPEMMVVAIPNTNRTRDMTPTKVTVGCDGKPAPGLASSGGMANFLAFITKELIPHLDGKYRTMPYRIFVGHSLGGITTINALYTVPEAFNAYIAIDPSLWWDNKTLVKQARDQVTRADWKHKVLYLAQANTLNPDDTTTNAHMDAMLRFNSVLESYNKSGLRYGYKYYDRDDHGSVPLVAEYDALRFIFDGYQLNFGRVLANPNLITEHYRAISEKLGATFLPSQEMLGFMATATFATNQDTAKAITFLELGTQYFPGNYRFWDRLGTLLAARGDKPKAIEAFQRSLAIKPDNGLTQNKLKELTGQ